MNDLLSSTLGAVGQVGDALDKYTGGRAIRGALIGNPRELASIIPFSDTMGITDEHDATSGRSLLDHYGITQAGDNSLGAHAAGFLADNVLSPGNWLGAAGAFKAAPTVAKGIQAGAKALSGLDLIDHAAAGAKGLASAGKNFLKNDAGSLRVPDLHSAFMNHIDASPAIGLGRQSGSGITAALAKQSPPPVGDLPWERAVRTGTDAGVRTNLVPADVAINAWTRAGHSREQAGRVAAWYNPFDNGVRLNDAVPEWRNTDLMDQFMQDMKQRRWYSTSDPNGIINHELGHHLHNQAVGTDAFVNDPKLQQFPFSHGEYVFNNLSQYGATKPQEAIAELVAALKGGEQFDPNQQAGLSNILWNYGGKNLWQMLGDQKLLKPLGYSVLAGAAGANMIPQDS